MLKKINNYKWLVIVLLMVAILIIEFVKVVRLIDIYGVMNISADGWLAFVGSIVSMIIPTIGLVITVYKYLKEIEEKEKPLIIIKSADAKEYNYVCNTEDKEYTQHRSVCFELINKGNVIAKNPRIKDCKSRISNINKRGTENELDIIEPEILQTANKYVICIDINYMEGMGEVITNSFELQYRNHKNKEYKCHFEIEISRHNNNETKVYMKEL